jgi:hypothetical protein
MSLSSDDVQNMHLDAKYIPDPIVNDRLSCRFHMSTAVDIAYESDFVILPAHILQGLFSFCQILKNERLLLVLVDREKVLIYLELLPAIDAAIRRNRPVKSFNREKLGQDVLFAYDEMKRTLAVCASSRVRRSHLPGVLVSLTIRDQLQLHVFVFDETFKTLHAQGSVIDLAPWYSQAVISILQVAFVNGKEEVVLVDSSTRARIFSFITLQFRCGSQYVVMSPPTLLTGSEDRLLCRFRHFPMRYSPLLMGHASYPFMIKTPNHPLLRIIGRHLALLPESLWMLQSFLFGGPS